jgi:RimJ/RimL family protein N-acetyltransferase
MSLAGRSLVDGDGAQRIVTRLLGERVRLRRARAADAELLWGWANDPGVRRVSYSEAPIPWETHVAWLESRLRDRRCAIFIALDGEDSPVGQIRFGLTSDAEGEIDVSVDAARRGSGLGPLLIRRGVEELARTTAVETLAAFVREENGASAAAFARAGFSKERSIVRRGKPTLEFRWERKP